MTTARISRRRALAASGGLAALAAAGCARDEAPGSADDLAAMDGVATALAVKSGDISAVEAVGAAIERAERLDPRLHAIVTPYYDAAREAALRPRSGAWFGVPSFVKDLNHVIGQKTQFGSRAFADFVASEQSPFTDRFFENGLISLGKSATPEFGLTATTEPLSHAPTRNPWNTDYSVGGSSGGAAALVAAGVVPVAHGSDGGGSIRIPAACCGVVGLKPSRGRTPMTDGQGDVPIQLSSHCVESRTVRDTASFIAMMEIESALPKIGLVDGASSVRKRIRVFTASPLGGDVDPEVAQAVSAVAADLDRRGHEVEETASPFHAGVVQDFILYWASGAAKAVSDWERATARKATYKDFESWTWGLVEHYISRRDALPDAIGRLRAFEAEYAALFETTDLILSPTVATPPPRIGHLAPTHAFDLILERLVNFACFTPFMNIAGAPAISLPAGQSGAGLPIGCQFAAPVGGERALLDIAYEIEEIRPWKGRRPALFG